jgi:hypothetical protein
MEFKWPRNGRLTGQQQAKRMSWQVTLPEKRFAELSRKIRRMKRSKKEASRRRRFANNIMLLFYGNVAYDQKRTLVTAIIGNFKEVAPLLSV